LVYTRWMHLLKVLALVQQWNAMKGK